MGIADKLKGIVTWQSALVIMFYLGCILSITIIAIIYDIIWLMAAGATTLGIVSGSMLDRIKQVPGNKEEIRPQKEAETKAITEIRVAIAEVTTQFANMKSEFEVIKMFKGLNQVCGDEEGE